MGFFDLFKRKNKITPRKKESRIAMVAKGLSQVLWPERNYKNDCEETYMKNVIGYRAIKLVADAFSSVEWGLFKQNQKGDNTEIFNTEYNKILLRANPWESYNYILYQACAYLLLAGNSYVERIRPDMGKNNMIPLELHNHQPDKMSFKTSDKTGRIQFYQYRDGNQKADWEVNQLTGECDILHLKMFNPTNKHFGMGAVEPAARDIDINNLATEWNMRLIQNQNRPGMLLLFKGSLTEEQFDSLEKQFNDVSGPGDAGRILTIESDEGIVDAKPYNWSPAEMDWLESNRETARRIAMAFGVPSMLLGIPGDNTYSNYQEARAAMWEDTVIPLLNYFRGEFNNWIFGWMYGQPNIMKYDYNLDNVPALQIRRDAIWKRANESTFLTIDEKRELVGYKIYENPDPKKPGSAIVIASSQVPLDENFLAPPELPDDPLDDDPLGDDPLDGDDIE